MSERFCNLFLQNLKGERPDPISLSAEGIDEHHSLDLWQRPEPLFGHGLAYFLNYKLQLLYLFGETRQAWEFAQASASWMRYIPILYETAVYAFYRALAAARRIREAVEAEGISHECGTVAKVVTVSIGFTAATPLPGGNPHDMLQEADACLYQAKRNGRNQVFGVASD